MKLSLPNRLKCIRQLKLDQEKVNVNGGAIAFGHPLGASGARILTTLVHEMKKRKVQYGLATMCVGVGQGISAIIENISRMINRIWPLLARST